jgi:sugar phosphate isomerase/epimerase
MFRVGLNPYGLTYTLGLQGAGTPRANPDGRGLDGFVAIAREYRAGVIELDGRWLSPMTDAALSRLGEELAASGMSSICSFWLAQQPGETLAEAIRCTSALGAPLIRLHLTPVLEGARAAWGPRWDEMIAHARKTLTHEAPRAADAGLTIAIENHQDLGSEELIAIAVEAGGHVGIILDTGNPFALGEDPVAFTRRVNHLVRHVHLKDYAPQFTDEGYRLVRCAIGDGAVPLREMAEVLAARHTTLTASLEPGALEARHIRLFTPDWWRGYPPREASEVATAIGRLRRRQLDERADIRTPWERESAGEEIISYEMDQMRRSVDNVRAMGWM